ncbi:Transcriptional Regulator, GntR family protein [Propionibacterium freudenreichii]|nr:Transcriptional Regulator, GntR family protein [Propionibacterium freudenreichii]SBN42482.1 Propionate catabolism operon transcriptional regulator of GntR family [Propionibacterium freudenreichii]
MRACGVDQPRAGTISLPIRMPREVTIIQRSQTASLATVDSQSARIDQLTPLRSRALVDDVYDLLLDKLTSGELAPDTALGIDPLARQLRISPTPIREALARLEHTGLVHRAANRGYRVAPPLSLEQMLELLDARLVLEDGAIERAMRHAEDLLPDLDAAYEEHARAARALEGSGALHDQHRIHEYYAADWAFHQTILDHSHNRYISRAVNSLSFSFHRMRQTNAMGTTDAPVALAEHAAILNAVRTLDAAAAREALDVHLASLTKRATDAAGNPTD